MKKSLVRLFVFLTSFGMFTTSCEDMLTPDMDRYADKFNGTDTVNFYLGIMRNVQDMVEQNVLLGEIRADLADTTLYSSDSIARILRYDQSIKDGESKLLNRAAYYKVINQCNFYIATADSMAVKNDNYYMRKEIAQVHMMRAWVYMQLVQLYGKVPFITVPVDNANTGWEVNPAEGWATPENLIELLEPTLLQAAQFEKIYGFPNYGTFSTGKSGVTIPHKLLLFPSDLVLGDLYLLRGNGLADYEKAAQYYYTWLEENKRSGVSGAATYDIRDINNKDVIMVNPRGWSSGLQSYAAGSETIVAIPSAANYSFGSVLSNVVGVYGFKVSSSNTTSTESDGEEDVTATSGEINIAADARLRQLGASQRYTALNKAQVYVYEKEAKKEGLNKELKYYNLGDARYHGTVPYYKTKNDGEVQFVQKFGPTSNYSGMEKAYASNYEFKYQIPVYRLRQVWLRFAEAINRCGFPSYAFSILRDGVTFDNFPKLQDSIKLDFLYDEVSVDGDTLKLYYKGTFSPDTTHMSEKTMDIAPDELYRAQEKTYLKFDESDWRNSGIHSLGCGTFTDMDTVYVYRKVVADRVKALKEYYGYTEEAPEANQPASRIVTLPSDTLEIIVDTVRIEPKVAEPWDIEAVETLIADEMALETAFEGYRFFDLTRMARHKNKGNLVNGTEWFAWMIANRSVNKAPYAPAEPGEADAKDMYLYNLLQSEQNWYLPSPAN